MSFGAQSFPRKRESTPQAFGNVLSSDWIPPAERDGNDRRLEWISIPNDTTTTNGGGVSPFECRTASSPAMAGRDQPGQAP